MSPRRTTNRRQLLRASAAGAVSALAPRLSGAAEADPFFRGKTIRCIVGTAAGAAYDSVARVLARGIATQIPGLQGVVVENMVGAGSLTMMNYMATRAPKDGTAIGLPLNSALLEQSISLLSMGGGNAAFRTDDLTWLGSPCEEPPVFWVMQSAGIKRFEDLHTKSMVLGASQPGADNYALGLLNQKLLGAKLRMVSGYNGTNDLFLAAERGEIQGGCSSYSSLMVAKRGWIESGRIALIAQYGLDKLPGYENVPTAIDLASDATTKEMFRLYGSKFAAAYPFMMPSNVPPERVATVQSAFDAVVQDQAFAKTITEFGMRYKPIGGRDLARLVGQANNAPQAIRIAMKEALTR